MKRKTFRIDWEKLALLLLPISLRKTVLKAWLQALLFSIAQLHERFFAFVVDNDRRMNYNSQVCNLRRMLNDNFDPTLRRIKVEDAIRKDSLTLWRRAENRPRWLGRWMLWRRGELDVGRGFVVLIPSSTFSDEKKKEILSATRYYKLPGKHTTLKEY